jgi:hypothetical protein
VISLNLVLAELRLGLKNRQMGVVNNQTKQAFCGGNGLSKVSNIE